MTCEHCRRNPCGCVVVSDGTRYAPARRVCGEVFDAGGYPQGCTRAPHEGDDHRSDALVFASDLGAGGPSADLADWLETAKQDLELLRLDLMLFGHYEIRDGRRVPPSEWSRRGPAFASVADLRASGIPSEGSARRAWQLFPWWPDPLSFIGAAANEGRS